MNVARRSVLLGLAAAGLPLRAIARPGNASFGLMSPASGPALAAQRESPAARQVLARAEAGLSREPAPLPVVHTEGTLPGRGIRDVSLKAREDLYLMRDFALAWAMTGEDRYLQAAALFMAAWLDVYRISLNPIDETHFDTLVVASDLTRADLPPPLAARLDEFLRALATGYLGAMEAQDPLVVTNWQSHRIKVATLSAFATGDAGLIERAGTAFRRQIAGNIQADGSVHDFHERDAIHYVTYDLEPLLVAALAARRHGQDWFGWRAPHGAGLVSALDWLTPYALGEKTHQEFVHSTVAFDAQRNAAGVEGFSGPWKPDKSIPTFALARLLDPRYEAVLAHLTADGAHPVSAWLEMYRISR